MAITLKFRNKRSSLFLLYIYIYIYVGFKILCDDLYKLNLNSHFAESLLTLHHNVGTKHGLINEKSF
jgi:hypothetical protein